MRDGMRLKINTLVNNNNAAQFGSAVIFSDGNRRKMVLLMRGGSEVELIRPHSFPFAGISLLDAPALMNHLSCSVLIHEDGRRDVLNGL